jgi:hypothetical protein
MDWDSVTLLDTGEERGIWTDVNIKYGKKEWFCFTITSSYGTEAFLPGSVPEHIVDPKTGLWDLYVHKKYITQWDIGRACIKWVLLNGPVKGILWANVYFNGKHYGHAWPNGYYPREKFDFIEERRMMEYYCGRMTNVRGICS